MESEGCSFCKERENKRNKNIWSRSVQLIRKLNRVIVPLFTYEIQGDRKTGPDEDIAV